MNIKIYSRSLLVKNTIIFVFLSYLFLFFVENFNHPLIFENFDLLNKYSQENLLLGILTLFLALSIFFVSSGSKLLLIVFSLGIFIYSIRIYFIKDTPAILPLSLVYMMCSYYFYSLYSAEMKGAAYNPGFDSRDLNPVKFNNLYIQTIFRQNPIDSYLLNWDRGNMFIYIPKGKKLRGKLRFIIKFENIEFAFEGSVVTSYNKGYGIRMKPDSRGNLGWSDLYEILQDRGYIQNTKEIL